jgi:hypothetical protein
MSDHGAQATGSRTYTRSTTLRGRLRSPSRNRTSGISSNLTIAGSSTRYARRAEIDPLSRCPSATRAHSGDIWPGAAGATLHRGWLVSVSTVLLFGPSIILRWTPATGGALSEIQPHVFLPSSIRRVSGSNPRTRRVGPIRVPREAPAAISPFVVTVSGAAPSWPRSVRSSWAPPARASSPARRIPSGSCRVTGSLSMTSAKSVRCDGLLRHDDSIGAWRIRSNGAGRREACSQATSSRLDGQQPGNYR